MKEKSEIIGRLTVQEFSAVEKLWIKAVQACLKEKATFSQLVMQLGLVENEGILYCIGRLGKSDLSLEAQHPIVRDSKHQYTSLLIKQYHERVHHSGIRATLAEVR